MIVFPAQPYHGRRGVFNISDRYATFGFGQYQLLICSSSRPPLHNSRSRTIVMIRIPFTAQHQHTNLCIERNAMMARFSLVMAHLLALQRQNFRRKAFGLSLKLLTISACMCKRPLARHLTLTLRQGFRPTRG